MKHLLIDGLFIRHEGDGGEIKICYIHGLGESGLCFEALIKDAYFRSVEQIVIDLPGYGKSCWTDRPRSLVEMADIVHLMLDRHFPGRNVILAGHSMGGVIGQLICERHPGSLGGFINIEGNISSGDCVFSGKAAAQEEAAFVESGFHRLQEAVYRQGIEHPSLRGYYASMRMASPAQFYLNSRELVQYSDSETLASRMAGLPMPSRYIAGSPKGVCPYSLDLLRKSGVPVTEISPSGHWPFIDQPQDFIAAIHSFLHR